MSRCWHTLPLLNNTTAVAVIMNRPVLCLNVWRYALVCFLTAADDQKTYCNQNRQWVAQSTATTDNTKARQSLLAQTRVQTRSPLCWWRCSTQRKEENVHRNDRTAAGHGHMSFDMFILDTGGQLRKRTAAACLESPSIHAAPPNFMRWFMRLMREITVQKIYIKPRPAWKLQNPNK